ncbi:Response regulator receiver domain-containing protein [Eubacterium ruminantium]|nr:Response regulator receiver domain-containing protein [Eubacterium ruminantium]
MLTISCDDQVNVAEEIARMMGEIDPAGKHVAFGNAPDALKYTKENLPDVAWLDIEMPGMSGLEFAMEIKKISPKTNIIFVTGHEKFAYQSMQLHASGFILKPATIEALRRELDNLRVPVKKRSTGLLRVQCFGNFEVFDKNDQAVNFKRSRSKELLAYMVDRRGAMCSAGELCGILFEDREEDSALKKQLRVFMSSLRDDLSKLGAGNILVKGWNAYGVDCSLMDCDYYDYLKGDSYAINSFLGEYMLQYSWAEMTLGELLMKPESF